MLQFGLCLPDLDIKLNFNISKKSLLYDFYFTVKEGTPPNEVLEQLSQRIGKAWKKLGRRLLFNDESKITKFHKENEEYEEKSYQMLLYWKRSLGSDATYQVLYDALCHDLVEQRELAEKFCCVATEK